MSTLFCFFLLMPYRFSFTSCVMSRPTDALELLVDLGAMDEETNDLTDLGYCLSALSLEPRVGKMVIMSNLLGCSRSSTLMATAMSYKSPFALPPPSMRKASDQAKVKFSNGSESGKTELTDANF